MTIEIKVKAKTLKLAVCAFVLPFFTSAFGFWLYVTKISLDRYMELATSNDTSITTQIDREWALYTLIFNIIGVVIVGILEAMAIYLTIRTIKQS